jgi:hypothetical protein
VCLATGAVIGFPVLVASAAAHFGMFFGGRATVTYCGVEEPSGNPRGTRRIRQGYVIFDNG